MIELTQASMREIFPRAPQQVIDAFVTKQYVLTAAGINATRNRLKFFFANVEHECGGFSIPNLTENTNYSAPRMAQVWPNRFASAAAVVAKYGSAAGWQLRAFDDIYGNRMGNRSGTRDGSLFIGRAGPQVTGRDGYDQIEKRVPSLKATSDPKSIAAYHMQPEVCAAFWVWKNLNVKADVNDFNGCVRLWNGGTNGMADRLAMLEGNDPAIMRLAWVESLKPVVDGLNGKPPTPLPPDADIDEATKAGRAVRGSGVAVAVGTGGTKAVTTAVEAPAKPLVPMGVVYGGIGIAIATVIIGAVIVAKSRAAVIANWK